MPEVTGMDTYLAEMFNTADNIGAGAMSEEDRQKIAAAEFTAEVAKEAGIDVNALSDEEVVNLHTYVMEKVAEAPEGGEIDKEKLAEATQMGKVMAHSYVAELAAIEREKEGAPKDWLSAVKRFGRKAVGGAGEVTGISPFIRGRKGVAANVLTKAERTAAAKAPGGAAGKRARAISAAQEGAAAEAREGLQRMGITGAIGAGGVTAAEIARRLAGKERTVTASAGELTDAAWNRAFELLHENGHDIEKVAEAIDAVEAQLSNEPEKVASADVDAAAYEILDTYGFLQDQQ